MCLAAKANLSLRLQDRKFAGLFGGDVYFDLARDKPTISELQCPSQNSYVVFDVVLIGRDEG